MSRTLASNRTQIAFDPSWLSGLGLWLRADTQVWQTSDFSRTAQADADPVGGWRDQSGAAADGSQSTSTQRPLLKLAQQNNLPAVRFDGVDDNISLGNVSALNFDQANPFTLWAIFSGTNLSTQCAIMAKQLNSAPFTGWNLNSSNYKVNFILQGSTVGHYMQLEGGAIATSTYYTVVITYDGSSLAAGCGIRINGVAPTISVLHDNLDVSISGAAPVEIGSRQSAGLPFQGMIPECGIYTRKLSAADCGYLEAYLRTRYAHY